MPPNNFLIQFSGAHSRPDNKTAVCFLNFLLRMPVRSQAEYRTGASGIRSIFRFYHFDTVLYLLWTQEDYRYSESCFSDDSARRDNELTDWKTGKESPHASEPFTVVKSIRLYVFVSLVLTECVLI